MNLGQLKELIKECEDKEVSDDTMILVDTEAVAYNCHMVDITSTEIIDKDVLDENNLISLHLDEECKIMNWDRSCNTIYLILCLKIENNKILSKRCRAIFNNVDEMMNSMMGESVEWFRDLDKNYILIQERGLGTMGLPKNETWMKWNDEKHEYELCEKPEFLKHVLVSI